MGRLGWCNRLGLRCNVRGCGIDPAFATKIVRVPNDSLVDADLLGVRVEPGELAFMTTPHDKSKVYLPSADAHGGIIRRQEECHCVDDKMGFFSRDAL